MPTNRRAKAAARDRQAATGGKYTAARRATSANGGMDAELRREIAVAAGVAGVNPAGGSSDAARRALKAGIEPVVVTTIPVPEWARREGCEMSAVRVAGHLVSGEVLVRRPAGSRLCTLDILRVPGRRGGYTAYRTAHQPGAAAGTMAVVARVAVWWLTRPSSWVADGIRVIAAEYAHLRSVGDDDTAAWTLDYLRGRLVGFRARFQPGDAPDDVIEGVVQDVLPGDGGVADIILGDGRIRHLPIRDLAAILPNPPPPAADPGAASPLRDVGVGVGSVEGPALRESLPAADLQAVADGWFADLAGRPLPGGGGTPRLLPPHTSRDALRAASVVADLVDSGGTPVSVYVSVRLDPATGRVDGRVTAHVAEADADADSIAVVVADAASPGTHRDALRGVAVRATDDLWAAAELIADTLAARGFAVEKRERRFAGGGVHPFGGMQVGGTALAATVRRWAPAKRA